MSETDFGFERVAATEKAGRVAGVFSSVASRYDLMNDLMSGGLHRAWKAFTVALAGVRSGERVLDVAAGSGDLALEFARIWAPLSKIYDWYSFAVLPWLGKRVAGDEDAYRYLAESIRMHPDQEALKGMLERAGLDKVEYFNLSAGVVALHRGYKL